MKTIKNSQGIPAWSLDENYLYFGNKRIAISQIIKIRNYLYHTDPEDDPESFDDFYSVTSQSGIMLPLFYESEDEDTVEDMIAFLKQKTGITNVPILLDQKIYERFKNATYASFTNPSSSSAKTKSNTVSQKTESISEEIQNQRILIQQNKEIISLLKQMNENQEKMQTISAIYKRLDDLNHNLIVFYNTFKDISDENTAVSNRRYKQQQNQRKEDLQRQKDQEFVDAFIGKKVYW